MPSWRVKPELVIVISIGFLSAYAIWFTPQILAGGLVPRTMDFVSFYTAAQLALAKPEALYDLQAQSALQRTIFHPYTTPGGVLGYFNPPLLAYLIIPFTALPYNTSFWLFFSLNIVLFLFTSQQLNKLHNGTRKHHIAWIIGGLSYYPVFKCIFLGQNSIFSLLIWTITARSLLQGKWNLAARILAIQIFKPQLLVLAAPFLFLRSGWKITQRFALFSLILSIVSFIPVGLSGARDFLSLISQISNWNKINGIFLEGIQSWRGFFYSLLPSSDLSIINTMGVIFGGITGIICIIGWLQRKSTCLSREVLRLELSSIILATLLITPHAYNHDLTILLLPAALLIYNPSSQKKSRGLSVLFPLISAIFFITTFIQGILPRNQGIPLIQPLLFCSLILVLYEIYKCNRASAS